MRSAHRPLVLNTKLALAGLLLSCAAARAETLVTSGDWGTAANWSPALPTTGTDAVIGGGLSATINPTGSIAGNSIWVGVTAGAGTVTQNDNTLNIGTRLAIGNDGRNGTYSMSGGTVNGAARELILGRGGGTFTGGTGTFTMTGGVANFAITTFGNDSAAGNARNGILNISGGTYTNTGDFNMAQSAAAQATVNVQGGTLLSTGGNTHVGNNGTSGAKGTFNVSSGTYTKSAGEFRIANAGSSAGELNVTGGVFSAGRLDAGNGANSAATINIGGGAFTRSNGQYAAGAGSAVTINHTNGTLAHTDWTDFVPNATANGTWNQSGGTSTFASNLHMGLRGSATMNITGGVLNKATGAEFDIAEGRDTTLTTRGVLNLSGSGVVNVNSGNLSLARTAGTGTLNVNGGTFTKTTGNDTSVGGGANGHGYINVNGGQMTLAGTTQVGNSGQGTMTVSGGNANLSGILNLGNAASALGRLNVNGGTLNTASDVRIGNNGQGTVTHSGGVWNANGAWLTMADAATGAAGTYNLSGGTLNHNGGSGMHIGVRGNGTMTVNGTGRLNAGQMFVGRGEGGTSPTGRLTVQDNGQVRIDTLSVGFNTATGILNLEGGTFRVTTINNLVGGGSQFNWGAGALAPKNANSGSATGADLSLGTGFSQVRNSTTTFLSNANLTTGNAVNAASRLDLGGLYISGASTIFDHFEVGAGRTLNLASNSDVLEFDNSTVYLLRPFGFFTEDYASLPLVTTAAGATITGTFDTFLGLANDGRGFSQFTGVFTSASALPTNTWFLQQTASGITFHYKVAGFVPEPGTFGMMMVGAYGLRLLRRRRWLDPSR